jgi:hypothetical protein
MLQNKKPQAALHLKNSAFAQFLCYGFADTPWLRILINLNSDSGRT